MALLRKINLVKISKNLTIRVFSTENDKIKEESLRYYRTAESNPLKHDERHFGRLYSVPNEEFRVIAKLEEDQQNKSTFISTKLMKRNLALEEQTFMVRKPYLEILQYLRQINWSTQDNLRFILWGKMGTGKSTTMSQVHHFALNSNFIVIKFHSIRRWFSNYQEAVESEFKAGRWNFPHEARAVLEDFKYYNIKKIDGMVTHKTYQWSEAEMTPEGAPLSEVIESGLSRPRFSSDCLNVLLKEIKLNIQQGWNKHPVMIIIDGVNVLFQERTFVSKIKPRRKDRTIPIPKHISSACSPDELSVIVAIKHLLKNDFKNTCLVASVDRSLQLDLTKRAYGENKKWWRALQQNMVPETDPDYPFALLGNHGWDQLHPFVPIATNDYTEGELDAMIDYYADKSYIKSQSTTEKGRHEIRFLTGKNPGEFHNLSAFF